MQPDFPPATIPPPEPPPRDSKKNLILALAGILVLVTIGAVYIFTTKPFITRQAASPIPNTSKAVVISSSDRAVTYAGHAVYDACNLIPVALLKARIEKYDELISSMSSDKYPKDPLVIEHGYIDRSVGGILGHDDMAREPSISVSTTGTDSTVRAESFMSIMDSHCTYAQGRNFNSEFADVYVIQPPTPLAPQLTSYLNELKRQGKLATQSQGVEVYVEPIRQGDAELTIIFKKGSTVAFLSSLNQSLIQAASDEIVKSLAKEPVGPATITYPSFYSQLTNTCQLFSANDFQRLLGKPASALASEVWTLTESEKDTTSRECTRIELERHGAGEISSTQVGLSQSRTEAQTKARLATIKSDLSNSLTPLKNLGDEAYVVARSGDYKIVIRHGKLLLTIRSSGETKDADADAFVARTLPIAQIAAKNAKF